MLRSIDRDFDIRYYSIKLREAIDAVEGNARMLVAVEYDPTQELQDCQQMCQALINELELISY